uniref:RRM domain-containing protein n=2 Tax=Parascaris univalens TaxID=6257 RepID=A0A915ACG6_PARUN
KQMREEGGRWRSKGDEGGERWKNIKDEEVARSAKRDDDRARGGLNRHMSGRERSPRRRSREREGSRRSYRNDRMVYISNIPYDIRWMELKDLIREKAGEVNFVEILEDRNGKSKGAAVVEFREKDSVQRCVDALHRYPLNDRMLSAKEIRDPIAFFRKVKDDTGVDFLNGLHGRSQTDTRPLREESFDTYGLSPAFLRQLNIDGPLTNRVFVSNLPYNVQSGRVHDIFALAGKVTWVDLQLDKEGRSKGMAVVQFSHPIEAVQAISMLNNQRVFDRLINVKMDRFDPIDERREGELPIGLRGIGMGLGANGAPLSDVSSIISSLNSPAASSNIAVDAGQSAGFPSSQPAYQSSSYHSTSGIPSLLPFASSNSFASPTSSFTSASVPYTPSSFASYGSTSFVSRSIIIKNLPLDYTWQIVRDRVQQFGRVELTEMIAPGCAKVSFAVASDAERARKALQNTTVEGRTIGVEFLV